MPCLKNAAMSDGVRGFSRRPSYEPGGHGGEGQMRWVSASSSGYWRVRTSAAGSGVRLVIEMCAIVLGHVRADTADSTAARGYAGQPGTGREGAGWLRTNGWR